MGFPLYHIRLQDEDVDPYQAYGNDPNLFSIEFHHGGAFTKFPGRRYVNGKMNYIDLIDIDRFSSLELDDVLGELGYAELNFVDDEVPRFYHFLIPGSDLDFGLQALGGDSDVMNLAKYVSVHKLIKVYTEFFKSNLHTYFTSPSKVVIKEIDSCEEMQSNKQTPSLSRLMLEWNDPIPTQESMPLDFDDIHNFDPFMDSQPREPQSPEHDDVGEKQCDDKSNGENSDDDSDYIVDVDNLHEDVEVDMSNFHLHIDKDVENEVEINVGTKESDDIDVGHNEDFESGSEQDDITERCRRKYLKEIKKKQKEEAEKKNVTNFFYIGQTFSNKDEVKSLMREVSVETRRELKILKNDKDRVRVVCQGQMPCFQKSDDSGPLVGEKACGGGDNTSKPCAGNSTKKGPVLKNMGGRGIKTNPDRFSCPWVLLVSREKNSETWMVKTLIDEHKCLQSRKIKACTADYLSKHVVDHIESNPHIPTKALQEQLQRRLEVGVSKHQTFRAKLKARGQMKEDYTLQYLRLRDYMQELLNTNPGTTVKLEVEQPLNHTQETRMFKRIYVCLGELKKGFKAIGRELLGLDGAFMKGPFPGQILSAVGVNPNNGIYPVCYAIVEAETKSSWTWFLKCLRHDLDLQENSNFTFISDRQKGIIQAMEAVFPSAEHRFCLRHIHENMKLKWRGQAFQNLLWKCATASTIHQFHKAMDELKGFNQEAHLWLSKIPAKHWSRSHFSGRAHSDVLLNNMCEVFNKQLMDGRDKPILNALEFIREYIMKRIVKVLSTIEKSEGCLTPNANKLLDGNKKEANKYTVLWNGGEKYQVSGPWGDQCVVDVKEMVCTCRRWELNGIPYKHAVAANWNMAINGVQVPTPEGWVDPIYRVETWKKVYNFKVNPINGMSMWPKTNVPTKLLPPKHHTQVGRPKKKRVRSAGEVESSASKLSKRGVSMTCKKCGNVGHNQRTCKGQTSGV